MRPSACGRCGGGRCAESPGGRASCCAADVAHSNRSCALFPPPCAFRARATERVRRVDAHREEGCIRAHKFGRRALLSDQRRWQFGAPRRDDGGAVAAAGVDNTRVPAVYTDELGRMRAAGLDGLGAFNLVDTLTVNVALRDGCKCCESEKSAARTAAAARSMYRPSELGAARHIKAIATAAQSGAEFAVIAEDDISLATVPRWDHTLSDIVAMAPPGWRSSGCTRFTQTLVRARTTVQCAQRRPFLQVGISSRVGGGSRRQPRRHAENILNESGWPSVRRLSAFLTRAITAPLELGALAGGWGTAGKAAPDDLIPRTMYTGTYTFTRPLFLTSAVRSGIQTADVQEAGEEPANRVVMRPSFVAVGAGRRRSSARHSGATATSTFTRKRAATAARSASPDCEGDAWNFRVLRRDLFCGGKGCQNRPGGEEPRCGLAIRRRQRSCETHPPPCLRRWPQSSS